MGPKQRVLFLCTGNSFRSQMAEGLLRHLGGEGFEVFSAGMAPKPVHPMAVRAMQEVEVDISRQASKSLDAFAGRHFDTIITVCDRAREGCPIFHGDPEQIHWSFADPAEAAGPEEARMKVFRRVRDEIRHRIQLFLALKPGMA